MIPKAVNSIVKADVDSLLTNKVSEGRTLDYKLTLPGNNDEQKREFLADVSSFANAAGGDLIFGIKEEGGVPSDLPGLTAADLDAEKLRLEGSIRDGIDPRIPGVQLHPVPGFPNGPVLVMRIPQSFAAPHMVTFKNTSRFYTRNSAGKYQMDVAELRAAFDISAALGQRLQRFRTERLSKIIAGETPVPMPNTPKLVLHMLPLSSFNIGSYIDQGLQQTIQLKLRPLGSSGWNHRFNLDGVATYNGSQRHGIGDSYCQFFRNGAVEAVYADLVFTNAGNTFLGTGYEVELLKAVQGYLQGLNEIRVPVPVLITVTMMGVAKSQLYHGPRTFKIEPTPIDRDVLFLPEVIVESYDSDVTQIMRPILDAVWNSAGYERCFNYGEDGKWRPRT